MNLYFVQEFEVKRIVTIYLRVEWIYLTNRPRLDSLTYSLIRVRRSLSASFLLSISIREGGILFFANIQSHSNNPTYFLLKKLHNWIKSKSPLYIFHLWKSFIMEIRSWFDSENLKHLVLVQIDYFNMCWICNERKICFSC